MNAASLMSSPVYTARRDTLVTDVVRTMTEQRVSAVPIVDDQSRVVGVVTVSDLIPQLRNAPASNVPLLSLGDEYVDFASLGDAYQGFARLAASEVMHDAVITVRPEIEVVTVAQIMVEHALCALPVVREDGVLIGIVTRTDLARLAIDRGKR